MSRIAALLLALIWLGHAAFAPAQTMSTPPPFPYYLPLEPGNEALYANANSGEPAFRIAVVGLQDGAAVLTETWWGASTPSWRALVSEEPDGDVFVLAEAVGDEPFVPFTEPLPILDAPLDIGKCWSVGWEYWYCMDHEGWGPLYGWCVDAVEDIDVPAGRFHCQRVRIGRPCEIVPNDMYWYADGVGLVKMCLVSQGFGPGPPRTYVLTTSTVAVRPTTWGRVKTLYR